MNSASVVAETPNVETLSSLTISAPQKGKALNIGTGFTASTFRHSNFVGAMDPLVMVDHYQMSKPTFGAHPHAGLSAVTVLFEDSVGKFHNQDSLGNDFDLMPGDLYWLKAASGAVHDEKPRDGASTHGLQVFINLPNLMKHDSPESLHVKAQDMPTIAKDGMRVRVVLGNSNQTKGAVSPSLPMTILDAELDAGCNFTHDLQAKENAWIYLLNGEIEVNAGDKKVAMQAGEALSIEATSKVNTNLIELTNTASSTAHFVLFASVPVNESFVQKGPFVMSNEAEIARIEAAYAAGKLGQITPFTKN
ncbi:pirin family protein [Glaciecola sp. KUL10]|uniref:pirin family protein n=1 Tax=Glaciecola sp. (strain KUL10) TaxID=2161813 RepID=UPI000D788436|nr:pirin-like C-terminal cupin domain-containing protein [Glaciecola sp. KUL10]GBL05271.1 pirin-like protein [Glaciecola sp. KUL10]